jgi:hypothetical protein
MKSVQRDEKGEILSINLGQHLELNEIHPPFSKLAFRNEGMRLS